MAWERNFYNQDEEAYVCDDIVLGCVVVRQLPQFVKKTNDPRIADVMVRLASVMMRETRKATEDESRVQREIWFGSEKGGNHLVTMIETLARHSSRPGEAATELTIEARHVLNTVLMKLPREAKPVWARLEQEVLPALFRLDVRERVGQKASDECAQRLALTVQAAITLQKRARPQVIAEAHAVIQQAPWDGTSSAEPCGHVICRYPRLMRMAAEHANEPVPEWAQPQDGDALTPPVS